MTPSDDEHSYWFESMGSKQNPSEVASEADYKATVEATIRDVLGAK